MAFSDLTNEDLIARVGWRPDYILNSMITIRKPDQQTVLQIVPTSSAGPIDVFPTEILHSILNMLDFRSLSRFARACHGTRTMVKSLPPYRNVIKHASTALIALNRTGLITLHSAETLHKALRSKNCISCGNFGPFLLLLTAERCCYTCLQRNPSLWVITTRLARLCFGISLKHYGRIPVMLSIPGTYSVGHKVSRQKRIRLVSLKQVKEQSISVHGSRQAMENTVISQNAGKLTHVQSLVVRWLTGPYSDSGSQCSITSGSCANIPNDDFCGMASTFFPSLHHDNSLEEGIWCYGCRLNFERYSRTREPEEGADPHLSCNYWMSAYLEFERRARSKDQFLEHIKGCKESKRLLKESEQQNEISEATKQ